EGVARYETETLMNDDKALLQAVIDEPHDDMPRLVYADWLDEHEEPARAEFIRVQCSLDKMPADAPRRRVLLQREQELLDQYGWMWAEELGPQVSQWVYRRGFIERVEMCLEISAAEIVAALRKAPIRHIRDTSQFCELSGLVEALPHLTHLTGL